jgi:hypothetical protein
VSVTYGAVGVVIAVGLFMFWSSMKDLKEDAKQTAKTEARTAVNAVLEKPEIQAIISQAVQEKVGPAVDAEIQKSFGDKMHALESQQEGFAEMSALAAAVEAEDSRAFPKMIKQMYGNPNPNLTEFARQSLRRLANSEEERIKNTTPNSLGYYANSPGPKELIGRINNPQTNAFNMATAFHDMKKFTGWNVEMFDVRAANAWCAKNKPTCDQNKPGMR